MTQVTEAVYKKKSVTAESILKILSPDKKLHNSWVTYINI